MDIRGYFDNGAKRKLTSTASKSPSAVKVLKLRKRTMASGSVVKSSSIDKEINSNESKDMTYSSVVESFSQIEATKKRLEIQKILGNLFNLALNENDSIEGKVNSLTNLVYLSANKIAPDFHGVELGVGDGLLIKSLIKMTGSNTDTVKGKYEETGDLGKVVEALKGSQKSLFGYSPKALTVQRVLDDFRKIAKTSAQDDKIDIINRLVASASPLEAKFIVRSLQGKLRIGLAEQTVLIALAHVFSTEYRKSAARESKKVASEQVKNVFFQMPVYEELVKALVTLDGTKGIEDYCSIKAGIPLKPMLAKPTNGVSVIFSRFADVDFTCEYKYDGERAQIHLSEDGEIQIYSRNCENQTEKYPDLVPVITELVKNSNIKSFILDSEVVAYDGQAGKILPFQKLTTRKRKDVSLKNIKVPILICAFDMLLFNGVSLLDKPLSERRNVLRTNFVEVENKFIFAKSLDTNVKKHEEDEDEIVTFLNKSIVDSCEGLMVKTLHDTYEPSKRSQNWLKLKKDYMNGLSDSFDLVVVGAFFGKGKRTGKYGSFMLASYNRDEEALEAITKIGTGFSDDFLQFITEKLQKTVVSEKPSHVRCGLKADNWFEPTYVWEVRAADLSVSPVYQSAIGLINPSKGIALRFPRFLRERDDKSVEQATNREQVADMYRQQNLHTTESDKESVI